MSTVGELNSKEGSQPEKQSCERSEEKSCGQLERELGSQPEPYGQKEIADKIQTSWAGRTIKFYESIDSTNAGAKLEAEKGAPSGTLIVADMQTAGRGRRGRSWSSPAGTNVYYTLILRPDFEQEKASMLTLLMALSVVGGVKKTLQMDTEAAEVTETAEGTMPDIRIKWPNDVVVNGRKICGILTELNMGKDGGWYVIIGVGINVGKQAFAPELADKATTLEAEYGKGINGLIPSKISRSALIAHIMEAFEEDYAVFCRHGNLAGLKDKYEALLVNKDKEVTVLDPKGEYRGTARGINDVGELLVELPDGQVTEVCAGEVSVRGIYGYTV